MSDMRTCHLCGTETDTFCPTCIAAFPNRKSAADMSAEERAAELEQWIGVLEIPFAMMCERITELAGRPVWTHELGRPELIVAEIRNETPASFGDVLAKMPYSKLVVVADASEVRS